jgi:hypothetical protein
MDTMNERPRRSSSHSGGLAFAAAIEELDRVALLLKKNRQIELDSDVSF